MTTLQNPTSTIASVVSADGSTITTETIGAGATVVIVDPAMSSRRDSAKLATALAGHFAVVTFDRRGRGDSEDRSGGAPDPNSEVDDIAAVIAGSGGSALLFGSSSGAVLALEAATKLGPQRVTGIVLYEPPFIVDDSRPPLDPGLPARVADAVARGERSQAVRAFFIEAVGVPRFMVAIMRLLPMWSRAKAIVPTTRYDFAVLEGTQTGAPLPADRWAALTAPGLVLVGSKSEPFFHSAARALAAAVPSIRSEALEGAHHGSPQMSPDGIAQRIITEFGAGRAAV
jgi:pimeloyl-ACP methyl ester carboxylesterase